MKKLFNLAVILLMLTSCSILYYPTNATSDNYDRSIYLKWKASQLAQDQAALIYTQSAEFKAKHNGPSNPFEPILGKSVINTSDDPFKDLRKSDATTSSPTTQYYSVKIK
jgi:hypothetical protein